MTPEALREFGYRVREARVRKGWTLDTLAQNALANGDRKGYLSQVENGKRTLSPLTIGNLARVLELPESVTGPLLRQPSPEPDELTAEDRDAERLLRLTERDETAPQTAEALLIALAYEFAQGPHIDLQTAYAGLRAALEAAAKIKARGALPQNTGDQLQAVLQEVSRLNDLGLVEEAAEELDAAMQRVEAEREAIFHAQLDQDRIRNRPDAAAARLIRDLHRQAPPGGVFSATRDLLHEWGERGERQGSPFDLQVALALAKRNQDRAKGPQKGPALGDLGACNSWLGQRSAEDRHLKIAVKAFRECLKLMPRRVDPKNWATTQNNLGNALERLGEREADPARLREAVAAFEAALTVRTREAAPMEWATTQNNLGAALQALGERGADPARLRAAIAAFEAALAVRTREAAPMDWAGTQNNLGLARRWLGDLTGDAAELDAARAAYDLCLTERTRDAVPFLWAQTQWNLADLGLVRHRLSQDPAHLKIARAHALAAREVFAEGSEHQTERCDELLAKIDAAEKGGG